MLHLTEERQALIQQATASLKLDSPSAPSFDSNHSAQYSAPPSSTYSTLTRTNTENNAGRATENTPMATMPLTPTRAERGA
ncbi:hypothetical protein MMC25_006277 [Agyrium rufum]|nr:hypothetical protein [Agyrium rufum]